MEGKVSVEETIFICCWFLVPALPDGACVSNLDEPVCSISRERPSIPGPLLCSSTSTPACPPADGSSGTVSLENIPQLAWATRPSQSGTHLKNIYMCLWARVHCMGSHSPLSLLIGTFELQKFPGDYGCMLGPSGSPGEGYSVFPLLPPAFYLNALLQAYLLWH